MCYRAVEGYAPLLVGEVILRVGEVETTNPGEVFAQFGKAQGKSVAVAVMRQKTPRTLTVLVPVEAMPSALAMPLLSIAYTCSVELTRCEFDILSV